MASLCEWLYLEGWLYLIVSQSEVASTIFNFFVFQIGTQNIASELQQKSYNFSEYSQDLNNQRVKYFNSGN